jgi:uncharacterized membrane protein YraQ (UPF0718 family)
MGGAVDVVDAVPDHGTVGRPRLAVSRHASPTRASWRPRGLEIFAAAAVVVLFVRPWLLRVSAGPATQAWLTIFVSIVVQAVPFVVLGTVLSAGIATLVPPGFFARALPRKPGLAVPVAGVCGVVLPGCDCASVPVAGALVRRGVTPAAALAFLLSAPAINPVVLVATSVAFPGRPQMVLARFGASLLVSVLMGWLWLRLGRSDLIRMPDRHEHAGAGRFTAFTAAMRHDLVSAGGFLAIGAAGAATLNVVVPQRWLQAVATHQIASIAVLALLAVVLAVCSEADAFVAASLTQFSLTARLAFLVVGPMVDVKLFAMQVGTFGRRFALRFAPATLIVGTLVAGVVGAWTWGLS